MGRLTKKLNEALEEAEGARLAERNLPKEVQSILTKNNEDMVQAHKNLNEKRRELCEIEDLLTDNQRTYNKHKNEMQKKILEQEDLITTMRQESHDLKKNFDGHQITFEHNHSPSTIHQQNISTLTASRDLHQLMLLSRKRGRDSVSNKGFVRSSSVATGASGVGPGT